MKKGFTLAEVLITLGIIGIVAAMTIPGLLQNHYEKRTVTQLRATQSIVAQAIRLAEEEYGPMDGWIEKSTENSETAIAFAEKLKPFLKIAVDCGTDDAGSRCVYNGNYKLKDNSSTVNYGYQSAFYKVKLLNGSTIFWRGNEANVDGYNNKRALIVIFVDTNGPNKPNQWGKDLFNFSYHPDYGLIANGAPNSSLEYNYYCLRKDSPGWGCAYYVLNFQNMNYLHTK